jgi:group I intron endonuclease
MNKSYLYTIMNLVNGKIYVGITNDPKRRWWQHCSGNSGLIVSKAIKKYGKENFSFTVWYCGPESRIKTMEQKFIRVLNTKVPHGHGYNVTDGGDGTSGHIVSEETRKKWSVLRRGINNRKNTPQTKEERKRIGDLNRGRKISGKVMQTKGCMFKGHKHSLETKRNMSLTRKDGNHPCAKPITINYIEYSCIKEAARLLNTNYSTLRYRFRRYGLTGHWPPGCGYIVKQTT